VSRRAGHVLAFFVAASIFLLAFLTAGDASAQLEPEPVPILPPGKQLPPIPASPPPSREPASAKPKSPGEADDDQPRCEQAFIEHVYKATKPSVVRITRPDGGLGTGFVFFSNRHVATALHVVDLGRDVRVEFPGGKQTSAEVVAWDEEHDLAILELAEPADAPPLVPRWNISIGAPILAIGNPYGDLPRFSRELEGLLNFSVSQGIVSAKTDSLIQTDAVLSPGNSGGPMLSCDGHVVGIADKLLEARIGFGVPVIHLSNLVGKIGTKKYLGHWTGRDGAIGIAWNVDASTYYGPYLGGSIVGFDRVSITTRIGILFAGKNTTSDPVVDRSIRRIFGELVLGYRVLLFPYAFPTYFTLGAGVLGTIDRGEETRLGASLGPPGCAGTACIPTLAATTTAIRGGGIEPLGNAVLHIGGLELSYGYALDVIHPDYSTHRVLLGLSL
jgi:S1-C subfamily serine protease